VAAKRIRLGLAVAVLLVGVGATDAQRAASVGRPPWACDRLEQPKLDRQASRRAEPIPYKDPGWLFRLIGAYAARHQTDWAGFFFDTSPKGKGNPVYFHALFTEDVLKHARAIRHRAKIPSAFRFSRAPVSLRELKAVAQRIGREQFDHEPPEPYLGATAIFVGYDEPTNSVIVGLEDYSADAARAFHERYGPRVCVKLRDAEPLVLLRE
jgi:hypothetical protein